MNPLSQYIAIGKLVALLGAIALICFQSSQIHRWHKHYDSEHAAHLRDNAAYAQAQKDAAAKNHAEVSASQAEYKKDSDNAKDAYARDHAELVRMRAQRDAAIASAAGHAGTPKDSATASGTDGHGMPVPACDDVQTKDAAADIELRLMHLQNYVESILLTNAKPSQ